MCLENFASAVPLIEVKEIVKQNNESNLCKTNLPLEVVQGLCPEKTKHCAQKGICQDLSLPKSSKLRCFGFGRARVGRGSPEGILAENDDSDVLGFHGCFHTSSALLI